MNWHRLLERPGFYNFSQKILSIIAFGNHGIADFLKGYFGAGQSILDLGCGTGRYADIFGDCYTGVDNNPSYIEAAEKNHPGNFLVADAAKLDFLKQRFDNVLSINTFHHLSDEQISLAVGQMKKLALKQIIVIDPVYPSKFNFLGYFLFKIDRGEYRRNYSQHKGLLESLGFKVIEPRLKNSFPYRVCVFQYKIS